MLTMGVLLKVMCFRHGPTNLQVVGGQRSMLLRISRFSGIIAANGWAAGQVCKKWMVLRANLQLMGAMGAGSHPLLANVSEI